MSELYTLGQALRAHTADPDLTMDLGPLLAETMLKQSDLHEAFGKQAENYDLPVFLQPESFSAVEGETGELAAEAAAFLQKHGKTLIHDGLSADSIILDGDHAEVQYSEEAFRGPFGYDMASLMVSGLLGWCHGNALIDDAFEREDFCDCCLDIISNLADQLIGTYDRLFDELADAPGTEAEDFKRLYFEGMMPDLAAAAGLETLRILTGQRPSKELEEITASGKREETDRILLYFARTCIKERDAFYFGADFAAAVERAARVVNGD